MKTCSRCKNTKPYSEFSWNQTRYRNQCKNCRASIQCKKYRENQTIRDNNYYSTIFRKYGLTKTDYWKILDQQNFECKICKSDLDTTISKFICVDHCHVTNKVRGLLCSNCNKGLGHFKDSIERLQNAITYLAEVGV